MRISQLSNAMSVSNLFLNRATNEYNKSAERIATGKKLTTDIASQLGTLSSLKSHKIQAEVENENLASAKDVANIKASALQDITDLAQNILAEYNKSEANDDAIAAYKAEIDNIITGTKYKDTNVFQETAISFGNYSLSASGITNADDRKFTDDTETKAFLDLVASEAGTLSAQSRGIDARTKINTTTISNLEDAISRIEDVDIADENIKLARHNTQQILAANMISTMQEQQGNLINLLI